MPTSSTANRIGLGTAQFGSNYGITNRAGQIGESEAAAILALAAENGTDTIDTARLYGDSESVIGRALPARTRFRIVTKSGRFGSARDVRAAVELLHADFAASLAALRRPSIYALLIHDPRDLIGPFGAALWTGLEELKQSGGAEKIGVSVYGAEELDRILDLYPIDIVQLPFNAIDRRLARGGQLARLARARVEIHARSLFLQGLLLAPVEQVPSPFQPIRAAVERLDTVFAERGLSRLEGLLAIALSERSISRFIVGVTSTDELDAILLAMKQAAEVEPFDLDEPSIDDRYLNPARWPS